ncbi:MAG TPA: DoxX family protein [Thermoanaerobaculia bacterium]
MNWLRRLAPQIYAILRFLTGIMLAMHGTQKLWAWPGGKVATDPLMIFAGWVEVVAGVLIAVGFLTTWAAFVASGVMAVAYFWRHASGGFFPIVNKGELAVAYCWLFLYIAATGAGIWSVDAARRRTRR